ncbi:TPA: hypothetical protein ACH3X1_012820 [Trebouxia sp. C0004]
MDANKVQDFTAQASGFQQADTDFSPMQQTDPTPGCELDVPLLPFLPHVCTVQTSREPPEAPRHRPATRMWSAAPNAPPFMPLLGTPLAAAQMMQSQQLLQRHMTQLQMVHPQQPHLLLPQMSQQQMAQPRMSQLQGCQSHWSQTQTLQSHAQTLRCQPQMLQSQTQMSRAYVQMLQSHMHDAKQTHESCRAVPNMTPRQGVPSQQLQQLLALMSVPYKGQSEAELVPYASASQGPWVADQCVPGFLHTPSHPPQLMTARPHVDAAGQLQSQAFAQPPLTLDQHESAYQSAHPLQESKTVNIHSLQELIATADQQLVMLCQLPAPIQSADDLLCRLNNMCSGSISTEQVDESR